MEKAARKKKCVEKERKKERIMRIEKEKDKEVKAGNQDEKQHLSSKREYMPRPRARFIPISSFISRIHGLYF
uniref:Uncharacterized protein n=1 Tax=Romanomermis culicivorax TaxID=13658 RepID=A0A915JPV4_ROMCU